MSARPYFLVDTEASLESARGRSLAASGALITIADLVLCDGASIPADDDCAASAMIGCGVGEWASIKNELLRSGEIGIVDGFVVPAVSWTKPEIDS